MTSPGPGDDPEPVSGFDPGRTAAVVIGIETYPNLAEARIPGAVEEARGFAEWLVRRGVLRERIFLCTKTEEDRSRPASESGWAAEPPVTSTGLRELFETTFKEWLGRNPTDLLVVFWMGHGYIVNRRRKLLCSDVRATSWHHFDFEELLMLLQQHAYPATQFMVVDACAVRIRVPVGLGLGHLEYTDLEINDSCRQFVLFSTSPSQASPAPVDGGPPTFAASFRKFCDEATPGPKWPPDLVAVAARIKKEYRRWGPTTPTLLIINWDGDVEDLGGCFEPRAPRIDELTMRCVGLSLVAVGGLIDPLFGLIAVGWGILLVGVLIILASFITRLLIPLVPRKYWRSLGWVGQPRRLGRPDPVIIPGRGRKRRSFRFPTGRRAFLLVLSLLTEAAWLMTLLLRPAVLLVPSAALIDDSQQSDLVMEVFIKIEVRPGTILDIPYDGKKIWLGDNLRALRNVLDTEVERKPCWDLAYGNKIKVLSMYAKVDGRPVVLPNFQPVEATISGSSIPQVLPFGN